MPRGEDLAKLAVKKETEYNLINVKPELTYCSGGHEFDAQIQGIYSDYAVSFLCGQCGERWAVCCKCKSNTQHLYNRKAIRSHKSKQHKIMGELAVKRKIDDIISETNELENLHPGRSEVDDSMMVYYPDDIAPLVNASGSLKTDEPKQSSAIWSSYPILFNAIPDHSDLGFSSERSKCLFQFCNTREQQTSFAEAAVEFLTTKCLMNASLVNSDLRMTAPIPFEFRTMLIEYAFLCFRNGKKNRDLLCRIMKKLHTSGMRDGWKCCQKSIEEAVCHPGHSSWLDGKDFIHSYVSETFCPTKVIDGAHHFSLDVPMTEKKIRSMFMEGKFSIINNLPYPEVYDDIEDHAYVCLEECIRHALAFATCRAQVIDPFPEDYKERMNWMFTEEEVVDATMQQQRTNESSLPISDPSRTKRAFQIRANLGAPGVHVCYLYFWSDDADTNSQSMQGRAKVWVKSMTIGAPMGYGNLIGNTYPVAIGLKGVSHDQVEAKHSEELGRLQSDDLRPFFVGDVNQEVKCRFGVFANFGDQPEKRGSNGLALGSSLYAARSFVSACHKQLYPYLRACRSCLTEMRRCFQSGQVTAPLPRCHQCLNWDVLNTNNDLSLLPLPDNYPYEGRQRPNKPPLKIPGYVNRVVVKDGKRFIKPFQVTYEGLHNAIKEAHEGFCDHNWGGKITESFLKVELFNDETIVNILEYAERAKAYKTVVTTNLVIDPTLKREIERAYRENPALFGMMPLPSLHTRPGVSLLDHLEGIMHLLALGVAKRSVRDIQGALKATKSNKTFISATAKLLLPLIQFKLEWLKLMPYTGGKFHGWNANQWLAFVRVMPWFYQNVAETMKDPEERVELPSEGSQDHWLKKHNLHWLKIRGLDTKGSAPELKERVAELLKGSDTPPILPEITLPADLIQCLVNSLYDLMECLLGKSVSEATILKAQYAIRIFLSNYDDLDTTVREAKKTPAVISCYNFCCLLNLPEIMRSYGPLRHTWEGKYQGEALLPFIKEQHTQGIRTNWASNLLKNVLKERTFKVISGLQQSPGTSHINSDSLKQIHQLNECKDFLHIYKCIAEVNEAFETLQSNERKPLSIVLARDIESDNKLVKLLLFVHSLDEVLEIEMVEGTPETVTSRSKFGQYYYRFRLVQTKKTMALTEATTCFGTPLFEFAMLLPLLDKDETSLGLFAVVSHNWARLGPHNSLIDLVS